MQENIINKLTKLAFANRPFLACYLPVGDPNVPSNLAEIYATCGVDIFEVGVPTENPWMDGPDVTNSMQRTLAAGIDRAFIGKTIVEFGKRFEKQAIVVMGYPDINLDELLSEHCPQFDGLICVGANSAKLIESTTVSMNLSSVSPIPFVSFSVLPEEVEHARSVNSGYVMLQASPGKTGTRRELNSTLTEKIKYLKDSGISIPILPGFGISSPIQAAEAIRAGADGVIIGSACLQQANIGEFHIRKFLEDVRSAIDACS